MLRNIIKITFYRLFYRTIYEKQLGRYVVGARANYFLNSLVTCHTFTVLILGKEFLSIPRDFLYQLISKWNVKDFRLEFRFEAYSGHFNTMFSSNMDFILETSKDFSNAVFNVPFNTQPVSRVLLEKVEIDLQYSEDMLLEMNEQLENDYYSPMDNVIANVQRNFPAKSMTVLLPKTYLLITPDNMDRVTAKLIRLTEQNSQRNGSVTFNLYYQHDKGEKHIPEDIPDIFNSRARLVGEKPVDCWYLDDILNIPKENFKDGFGEVTVWYGKSFQIRNSTENRRMNFNIFYTKSYLKKFFNERHSRWVKTGFLLHFMDLIN